MKKLDIKITYGLLCGFAMSAWVMIEFALGFHSTSFEIGRYTGYFSIIIPIVLIFSALREKQSLSNGVLSVKVGIETGFNIAIISSIIFTIFLYFYNNHINPDWIGRMLDWQRKNLILSGASDDEIEAFMTQNRVRSSVIVQSITTFINSTGIGVITTLVEIPVIKYFFKRHNIV